MRLHSRILAAPASTNSLERHMMSQYTTPNLTIGASDGHRLRLPLQEGRHSSRRLLPAEGLLGVDAVALQQDALSLTGHHAQGDSGKSETPSPGETSRYGGRTSYDARRRPVLDPPAVGQATRLRKPVPGLVSPPTGPATGGSIHLLLRQPKALTRLPVVSPARGRFRRCHGLARWRS